MSADNYLATAHQISRDFPGTNFQFRRLRSCHHKPFIQPNFAEIWARRSFPIRPKGQTTFLRQRSISWRLQPAQRIEFRSENPRHAAEAKPGNETSHDRAERHPRTGVASDFIVLSHPPHRRATERESDDDTSSAYIG